MAQSSCTCRFTVSTGVVGVRGFTGGGEGSTNWQVPKSKDGMREQICSTCIEIYSHVKDCHWGQWQQFSYLEYLERQTFYLKPV